MHPFEGLAGSMEWAARDLAYNLDFIPDDKLDWKPAPTAKSALECAAESAYFTRAMLGRLAGGEMKFEQPETLDKATVQQELRAGAVEYAQALRDFPVEKMGDMEEMPFGTFPLGQLVTFPVLDAIHHRGQVCYIQTLLGDTENHFQMG